MNKKVRVYTNEKLLMVLPYLIQIKSDLKKYKRSIDELKNKVQSRLDRNFQNETDKKVTMDLISIDNESRRSMITRFSEIEFELLSKFGATLSDDMVLSVVMTIEQDIFCLIIPDEVTDTFTIFPFEGDIDDATEYTVR